MHPVHWLHAAVRHADSGLQYGALVFLPRRKARSRGTESWSNGRAAPVRPRHLEVVRGHVPGGRTAGRRTAARDQKARGNRRRRPLRPTSPPTSGAPWPPRKLEIIEANEARRRIERTLDGTGTRWSGSTASSSIDSIPAPGSTLTVSPADGKPSPPAALGRWTTAGSRLP